MMTTMTLTCLLQMRMMPMMLLLQFARNAWQNMLPKNLKASSNGSFVSMKVKYNVSVEPAVVAKSSVVLEVKPWDDETDMKALEQAVRSIQMDGLVWGSGETG